MNTLIWFHFMFLSLIRCSNARSMVPIVTSQQDVENQDGRQVAGRDSASVPSLSSLVINPVRYCLTHKASFIRIRHSCSFLLQEYNFIRYDKQVFLYIFKMSFRMFRNIFCLWSINSQLYSFCWLFDLYLLNWKKIVSLFHRNSPPFEFITSSFLTIADKVLEICMLPVFKWLDVT